MILGLLLLLIVTEKVIFGSLDFFFVTLHPICENWLHLSIIQINLILLRFAQLLHPNL